MPALDVARRSPPIETVRSLSRSFAVLDAILSPAGDEYHGFDGRTSQEPSSKASANSRNRKEDRAS